MFLTLACGYMVADDGVADLKKAHLFPVVKQQFSLIFANVLSCCVVVRLEEADRLVIVS